ncbi:MAG: hypothetical protein NTU60_02590 [Candidatus Aminicenantes bacterium]|nr:hypothetical protein [Candidatus Aminicenantes bacterium]
MKNKAWPAAVFICLLTAGILALAQFKPEEIAQREQWEDFLLTAEIVKSEPIGEGVTKPQKLYLKKGDVERKAAWKNPSGKPDGVYDNWKFEIAAYRLDKLLGLNSVPPVVERELKGKAGCLSLWAESKTNYLKLMESGTSIPPEAIERTDRMKYICRMWDCLIANADRTQENILLTEDWRTIIFDHSRAFQSDRKFVRQLVFGTNGIFKLDDGRPMLFRRVPRAMVEKIKGLTAAVIRQAVGPYLTDKEIEGVVSRVPLIMKEIEDMIKQNGENNVLY